MSTRIRTGANESPSGNRIVAGAVGAGDALRRGARQLQVRLSRQVPRTRPAVDDRGLEQPRIRLVHRPRTGERREVRRPLRGRLARDPARNRA
jgi:hypothetical protein